MSASDAISNSLAPMRDKLFAFRDALGLGQDVTASSRDLIDCLDAARGCIVTNRSEFDAQLATPRYSVFGDLLPCIRYDIDELLTRMRALSCAIRALVRDTGDRDAIARFANSGADVWRGADDLRQINQILVEA